MEHASTMILCEGQSEESFIKRILSPYLERYGASVIPVVLGGVSHYAQIRKELKNLGKNPSVRLTTMLDFYKLPLDVPGVATCKKTTPSGMALYIEQSIYQNLKDEIYSICFFPYIQMHEYEALLFSDVREFLNCNGMGNAQVTALEKQIVKFDTPEHVNNSEQTAPSKRILQVYPEYQKVTDGTIVAEHIGIEKMLEKCPHFAEWVGKFT